MNTKKSPEADLEKKRPMFFNIGLALSLSLALMAFEYASFYTIKEDGTSSIDDFIYEPDQIPITIREVEKPEVQKETKQEIRQNTKDFVIVDNTEKIVEKKADPVAIDTGLALDLILPPPVDTTPPAPFLIVEDMPYICNCEKIRNKEKRQACTDEAIYKHLRKHVKYPKKELELGIGGLVMVNYIVDENGNVTQANILRSVSPGLDKEALRVIKMLPCYKPGKQRGKKVKVSFNVPIKFTPKT